MFVIAKAGSGKGFVSKLMKILKLVDEELNSKCAIEWANFKKLSKSEKENTETPKSKGLYIPEDTTKAAFYDLLAYSNDYNMLFSSEASSTGNRNEMWDNKDIMLKASEHERISKARKDAPPLIIERPKLSVVLTGTLSSLRSQASSKEDGTFSRYIWYSFNSNIHEWTNQFIEEDDQFSKVIEDTAKKVKEIATLSKVPKIRFSLSKMQQALLNEYCSDLLSQLDAFTESDYGASIKRLAVKVLRIAGILTLCNRVNNDNEILEVEVCSDKDFNCALEIAKVIHFHSYQIFQTLSNVKESRSYSKLDKLLNVLPKNCELLHSAVSEYATKNNLSLGYKAISNYLRDLTNENLIIKRGHNRYFIPDNESSKISIPNVPIVPNVPNKEQVNLKSLEE